MNIGTAVVLIVLCAALILAFRSMLRDWKSGKSLQCGMDCGNCGGHCAHQGKM